MTPFPQGYHDGSDIAHTLVPQAAGWGASAITLHGRTREQRYSRCARPSPRFPPAVAPLLTHSPEEKTHTHSRHALPPLCACQTLPGREGAPSPRSPRSLRLRPAGWPTGRTSSAAWRRPSPAASRWWATATSSPGRTTTGDCVVPLQSTVCCVGVITTTGDYVCTAGDCVCTTAGACVSCTRGRAPTARGIPAGTALGGHRIPACCASVRPLPRALPATFQPHAHLHVQAPGGEPWPGHHLHRAGRPHQALDLYRDQGAPTLGHQRRWGRRASPPLLSALDALLQGARGGLPGVPARLGVRRSPLW